MTFLQTVSGFIPARGCSVGASVKGALFGFVLFLPAVVHQRIAALLFGCCPALVALRLGWLSRSGSSQWCVCVGS